MRAQLGNDIAITAGLSGRDAPVPGRRDYIAALHWNEVSSDADNKVLANGFPDAGLEFSFAGTARNVQFMVQGLEKVRRVRRPGICRLHERQTRKRGAARKVLSMPPACKRSRLRFHSLRAYA